MAHHVYRSRAFVLGGRDQGDANRYIDLLTRDLGFVRAVARSVRKEKSKLRYSLQPYTLSNVSLVRGKDVWRLTGAVEDVNFFHSLKHEPKKLELLHRVSETIRRLLQGEEHNQYLFDVLFACAEYLGKDDSIDEDSLLGVEYLTILRALYSLGYVVDRKDMFLTTEYTDEFMKEVLKDRKNIIQEINHALRESHL